MGEVEKVNTKVVSCDGSEEGHPKIYLNLEREKRVVCPYCSKIFVLMTN